MNIKSMHFSLYVHVQFPYAKIQEFRCYFPIKLNVQSILLSEDIMRVLCSKCFVASVATL